MNEQIANQIADGNEEVIKKQFEKLKYSVERLDGNKGSRRPDFLVLRSGRPEMICEVKTIHSAGYLHDKGVHVSMLEEKLGRFEISADRIQKQIDDRIEDAAHQRSELVKACPQFEHLPFLVALILDFFVGLEVYPRRFNEQVSGILTIKLDVELGKAFGELSRDEMERRLRTGDASGLPPNSKHFGLVRNKSALRQVPKHFQMQCCTEPYDESF